MEKGDTIQKPSKSEAKSGSDTETGSEGGSPVRKNKLGFHNKQLHANIVENKDSDFEVDTAYTEKLKQLLRSENILNDTEEGSLSPSSNHEEVVFGKDLPFETFIKSEPIDTGYESNLVSASEVMNNEIETYSYSPQIEVIASDHSLGLIVKEEIEVDNADNSAMNSLIAEPSNTVSESVETEEPIGGKKTQPDSFNKGIKNNDEISPDPSQEIVVNEESKNEDTPSRTSTPDSRETNETDTSLTSDSSDSDSSLDDLLSQIYRNSDSSKSLNI